LADRLVILVWHNVAGTWCYPARDGAGAQGFAHQLGLLQRYAAPVPLRPALEALSAGEPLPPRAVAITFDDGYQDNLDLAVPVLEKLGIPATFFLVPTLLSRELRPWWEVLAWGFARAGPAVIRWNGTELSTRGNRGRQAFRRVAERLKLLDRAARDRAVDQLLWQLEPEGRVDHQQLFLDWDGARALVRRGFTVGSHSMYHAILSRETPEEQRRDLTASRRELEAQLGVPAELLAYPNGTRHDYDRHTIQAAAQAGHAHALGAHAGINRSSTQPYEHPRFVVEPDRGFLQILLRRIAYRLLPTR
jgi:peptidoglycan/xylan/chitin deacetylase (PgdA/CDA1 family)